MLHAIWGKKCESAFLSKCFEGFESQAAVWNDLDLDVEPSESDLRGISRVALLAKCEAIYKKAIDKAATEKKKRQLDDQKRGKDKTKLLDALVAKSPEQHFTDAVDARVKAVLGSKEKAEAASRSQVLHRQRNMT